MLGILNFMIVNLFCAILLLHEDFNIISRFKAKVCKHIKLMMCFSIDQPDGNLPSTSTPVKARRRLVCQFDRSATGNGDSNDDDNRRGTKHDLTPGSKQNPSQPKTKRFLVGKTIS